jgi:hypothetical protein
MREASRSRQRGLIATNPQLEIYFRLVCGSTELVAFDSYGAAQRVVLSRGLALAPASFGSKRFSMLSGTMPTGGLAVLRIKLLPMQGSPRSAVLQAN